MENQLTSTSTATHEQIEMLLEFLQEHRDLARGYVRSVEGRIRSRTLWEQITQSLNSLGGAVKSPLQWQKGDENVDPNPQIISSMGETGTPMMDEEPEEVPVSLIDHPYASDFIAPPAPISSSTPRAHGSVHPPSRGTRRRFSQMRQQANPRGRLLELEHTKISEYAAIRAEMTKIRVLLESVVDHIKNKK